MQTRRSPLVLGLFALAAASALGGCGRKKSEVKPLAEGEGHDGKTCALPASGVLEKDAVVSTGCNVVVARTLVVKNGAKLVVEPGATLAFDPGTGLVVEKGVLLARGSDGAPVVFTAHSTAKSAGSWLGITFADDGAAGGSTLLHATVEYAGGTPIVAAAADAGPEIGVLTPKHFAVVGGPPRFVLPTAAAIVVAESARAVTLEEVRITHAPATGVLVRSVGSLAAFRSVSTDDVATAAVLPAAELGRVTSSTLAPGVTVFGRVATSTAWPKLAVPITIAEQLVVDSGDKKSPAILDVGEGNELHLLPGVGIDVGDAGTKKGAGVLVARKVRFLASSPTSGEEWASLALYDAPAGTVIDGCTFEHGGGFPAGSPGASGAFLVLGALDRAVLILPSNEKGVIIRHDTFRDNVGPAMSGGGESCHGHEAKSEGNVSIGQPLCWEDPFASIFGTSSLGAFDTGDSALGANMFGGSVGDSYGMGGLGMVGTGQGGGGNAGGIGLGNVGTLGKGSGGGTGTGYGKGGGGEIKPIDEKPKPAPNTQSKQKSP